MGEHLHLLVAQSGGAGLLGTLPMLLGVFGIWYFLIIRPQSKQRQTHNTLLQNLKRGDEIILSNGAFGKIHTVSEQTVLVDLAPQTRVKYLKSAVSALANNEAGAEVPASAPENSKATKNS